MKFVCIAIFSLLFSFCSISANAQNDFLSQRDLSAVNVDNYSDEQLSEIYDKAFSAGLSESQLYKMAAERGLPENEIAKLQQRLQFVNKKLKANSGLNNSNRYLTDTVPHAYDTSMSDLPRYQFKGDSTIFGSELFTSASMVFEPNLRIPAPSNYVLGPDDEIVISIYGYSEQKYNLRVNEQGEIYIPNVGPVLVNGITLEEAGQKIKAKLASTIYRNISSGRTNVQVTLGKIRSIRVTVIGQAKKPGNYTVSSLTTLYNILFISGGPTDMGSYRDIQIIRGGQNKRSADLYDFLVNGDQKDNALLQEGDVIRIPYYKDRVILAGNVKRQGKYEMKDKETFRDLLNFSGGFTDIAYRGAVSVIRLTDSSKNIIDLASANYDNFQINGSDEYVVGKLQDEFGNRVYISGSVLRPGPYQFIPGMTVKQLLEKSGGITVDAFTKRASIFRYFRNKMPAILSVNLDSILDYNMQVLLVKNDSIAIHSIFEFNDKNFVSAEGNLRRTGMLQWRNNMTLRDALLELGGISELGDSSNIEISRRIKNVNVGKDNHNESQLIHIDLTDNSVNPSDVHLQPFDIIMVKNIPGYVAQRSVLVLGEVIKPGKYGLQKSGDRISDVFERTGGFKASADSTSITIRRSVRSALTIEEREQMFRRILNVDSDSIQLQQRLRDDLNKKYDLISVDLATALTKPKSSENLSLEDGDILTINRNSTLVKVSGEVYFPTVVPYKPNKTLRYYVERAGNFMPQARKTGAMVIHPDGKVESVKSFLWFKTYPNVTPRSEIYVPQKQKSNRARIGAGEWALIVSALGIVANVFLQIKK
ncbi:MAG: SLBB domain-containing protein [Ginsengibacter sp.]